MGYSSQFSRAHPQHRLERWLFAWHLPPSKARTLLWLFNGLTHRTHSRIIFFDAKCRSNVKSRIALCQGFGQPFISRMCRYHKLLEILTGQLTCNLTLRSAPIVFSQFRSTSKCGNGNGLNLNGRMPTLCGRLIFGLIRCDGRCLINIDFRCGNFGKKPLEA